MIEIETECGATIYRGFFGKNANGDHDECSEVIRVELEGSFEEAAEEHDFRLCAPSQDDHERRAGPEDEFTICFGVQCPECGCLLEWPQVWTLA